MLKAGMLVHVLRPYEYPGFWYFLRPTNTHGLVYLGSLVFRGQ